MPRLVARTDRGGGLEAVRPAEDVRVTPGVSGETPKARVEGIEIDAVEMSREVWRKDVHHLGALGSGWQSVDPERRGLADDDVLAEPDRSVVCQCGSAAQDAKGSIEAGHDDRPLVIQQRERADEGHEATKRH
jgi:hypothetical protein